MASNLKDKSDAECRSLAGTYCAQRNKARRELEIAKARIVTLETKLGRLTDLAADMLEAAE